MSVENAPQHPNPSNATNVSRKPTSQADTDKTQAAMRDILPATAPKLEMPPAPVQAGATSAEIHTAGDQLENAIAAVGRVTLLGQSR